MLVLSTICMAFAFFVLITKTITFTRKFRLFLLQISSGLLLFFDRLAYIYSGDTRDTGYVMVRLTNFMVFILTPVVVVILNLYLSDLFRNEGCMEKMPFRTRLVDIICTAAIVMVILSQFTHWYYHFDGNNEYVRGPLFFLCYVFPLTGSVIQLTVVLENRRRISRGVWYSLVFFLVLPVLASIVQYNVYGLSLTNMTIVGAAMVAFIFSFLDINDRAEQAGKLAIQYHQEAHESMQKLFEETSSAIVDALDAKDPYTAGHSARVAKYARMIAERSGKTAEQCDEIYYGALLHDIGKISIPDRVLESDGTLSEADYEIWKSKSLRGDEILSKIGSYPFLRDYAHYVHERYDGSGYPAGLKGEEIPENVRILTVADYYDSMTSNKRYRSSYPQPFIREEFVMGAGTKFDPKYAEIMVSLIDDDEYFTMRESDSAQERELETEITCREYRSAVTKGIPIGHSVLDISFRYAPVADPAGEFSTPSMIVFDSFDGYIHKDRKSIDAFRYLEYGEIWFDGHFVCTGARNMKAELIDDATDDSDLCHIKVVRVDDHVRIRMNGMGKTSEIIVALHDSNKYAYIGLTGENCVLSDIRVADMHSVQEDIPRIAEAVTYIDRLQGDIPNIEIDGTRTAATDGLPLKDGLKISFKSTTLPFAEFVWNCPYIVIFSSEDGKVSGPGYREYALIKLNGETTCDEAFAANEPSIRKTEEFTNWSAWKDEIKKGTDVDVFFSVGRKKTVTVIETTGLAIVNKTTIFDDSVPVYVALTGDCCAITGIFVST